MLECENNIVAAASQYKGKCDLVTLSRQTVLHHAATLVEISAFEGLIDRGADVNALDGAYTNFAPLHIAAIADRPGKTSHVTTKTKTSHMTTKTWHKHVTTHNEAPNTIMP
jgi:hypothetical protein